ncbi:metallophosphoesterase [Deinococcus malanensis]|uniref:Metallophosphoesterase n=1 Tax=Deinococcus malanensis TaxID=1706855 RepID=A0ABQ2EST2_9DEIO|nr:metallophosphoesterase [Deinococcus malanensis]
MLLSLLLSWPLLSAAAPPAAETPLRLVILSDFNGSYGSLTYPAALTRAVQRTVEEWKPDAVLSAGDLIAGQKASLSDSTMRAMWASFDRDVYGPLQRAGIPFGFTLGNHDASLARDRREAARYWKARPPALEFVERSSFPFQYSFTLGEGRVFVASLDASGSQVGAAAQSWLAAQLATPQARRAGVRLVLGHLPLAGVSQGKNRPGEVLRDALALRTVMGKGKVLAYIHGHHAAFYPGRLGPLNVLSSGGIGGRDYVGYPGTARSTVNLLNVYPSAGRATFETFDADTGAQVPSARLPARLSGLGGPLNRVDDFR